VARYLKHSHSDPPNMKSYFTYIMSNAARTVLYTGVTNNLQRRLEEHRTGRGSVFTSRYRVTKLIWYQEFGEIEDAIAAEKRIKGGSRKRKIELIEMMNPEWRDLAE
jgi:putative endonuclease